MSPLLLHGLGIAWFTIGILRVMQLLVATILADDSPVFLSIGDSFPRGTRIAQQEDPRSREAERDLWFSHRDALATFEKGDTQNGLYQLQLHFMASVQVLGLDNALTQYICKELVVRCKSAGRDSQATRMLTFLWCAEIQARRDLLDDKTNYWDGRLRKEGPPPSVATEYRKNRQFMDEFLSFHWRMSFDPRQPRPRFPYAKYAKRAVALNTVNPQSP